MVLAGGLEGGLGTVVLIAGFWSIRFLLCSSLFFWMKLAFSADWFLLFCSKLYAFFGYFLMDWWYIRQRV